MPILPIKKPEDDNASETVAPSSPETAEAVKPSNGSLLGAFPEEKELSPFEKKELEVLSVSTVESREATPDDKVTESEDPDEEVKIIPSGSARRNKWWKKRKVWIPTAVLLVLIVLLAIPPVRYMALGWIWHKDVTVAVQDSRTGRGLKSATVTIGTLSAQTDESGVAHVKGVSLGHHDVVIKKSYYAEVSQPITVDLFSSDRQEVRVAATGKVVPLVIIDRISGKSVVGAEVISGSTKVGKTSADGKIDVVIPTDKKQLPLSISAPNFNKLKTDITSESKQVALTPAGALYFVSKLSGKLDVVKANLDGTDRKIVVPGTGSEDDRTTSLIASKDWKYAVLKAKRAASKPAGLYIVTTADDKYAVLDETNVEFTPVGWSGQYFIYQTSRSSEQWRAGSMQLKSYNAETGKTTVLDQSASDPASVQYNALYELFEMPNIIDNTVVYIKNWTSFGSASLSYEGKQSVIVSVKPDGAGRKTIKSFPSTTIGWVSSRLYRPESIYFQTTSQDMPPKDTYSELIGSDYKENVTPIVNYGTATYPVYRMSPSGKYSLWSEERDGKQAIFIGDKNAGNEEELASKSDYKPYGWLTDNWILLQKNDSELYITTKDQLKKGVEPLKVSDYHRASGGFSSYGYGG